MIVDSIIDLELEFLKNGRVPTVILLNIAQFNSLVKELDATRMLDKFHNMKLYIVTSVQLKVV